MSITQHAAQPFSFLTILKSISKTPHKLKKRALVTSTPDQELNPMRRRSGTDMKRKLEWYDLIALGVGGMLGAGVFVTTGHVARDISGPSVFISYMIAGISAFLSSLCYTEFSVQVPVAGGAFSYLRITFGEFVGYFGGANLLMEYVLSNAAVARSFTEYLTSTFGLNNPNSWRTKVNWLAEDYNMLDFPSVILILLLTLCLCHSTKESSMLNLVMTMFHVIFFGFIVAAGFYNGSTTNIVKPKGIAPYGVKGVLDGAAIVYFSYIGYDSVSTMAEEIRKPSKNLPIGIAGSVLIVSVLYCLMALALCSMIPYNEISNRASFASAFVKTVKWKWVGNVVGAGASLGIVASLLVAMLGQARYLCVLGRARLVPLFLAKVHPSTGTPMNATIFLGICTASIALFTDLSIVLEMISIGTLLVFYLVANALIYRRYVKLHHLNRPLPTLAYLASLTLVSMAFSLSWTKLNHKYSKWALPLLGLTAIAATVLFQSRVAPCNHSSSSRGTEWWVPMMPWPASVSVFLNVFLMASLNRRSFFRFGIWSFVIVTFYLLYGVHSTYHYNDNDGQDVEVEMNDQIADEFSQDNKAELV